MPKLDVISELGFSVSEAIDVLKPFAVLLAEVLIYSVFVFAFYRFVAKRDIVPPGLNQYSNRFASSVLYFIQHFLSFPILSIGWCAAFVVILAILGQEQPVENTIMVSVVLVSTIRATSYVSEDLSKDLAKMLPFAVLALYLIDMSYKSLIVSWGVVKELPDRWELIVYYIIFIVILEFLLRILYCIVCALKPQAQ